MSNDKSRLFFAATAPYVEQNIVKPTELIQAGNKIVEWGERNAYPEYLFGLYTEVPTLQTVIDGSTDYVCGNGSQVARTLHREAMNTKGETMDEITRNLAFSFFTYGGFAIQVIRNRGGEVSEIYALDFRNVRCLEDNEAFYYSEEWAKRTHTTRAILYPKFIPGDTGVPTSILYVKNTAFQTYPRPIYASAVKACEIERRIGDLHLNALQNNFMGSHIINFNNGIPEDEVKAEIEKNFDEKFAGTENAGRNMIAFNDTKENAVTVEKIEAADFFDHYQFADQYSRQKIFTAFRANPNLFGIPTENLGFSSEEYKSAFNLYNRTQIIPAQRRICEAVGKIFGDPEFMTIEPFTIG